MSHHPALVAVGLLCLGLPLAAAPARAGGPVRTSGSYDVELYPDPTQDLNVVGDACGAPAGGLSMYVAGKYVGVQVRRLALPRAGTLRASLVEHLNAFAGDVGLNWSLRVYAGGKELARSGGPAWKTEVTATVPARKDVRLVTCNRKGYPHATVSWSFTPAR